MSKLSSAEEKCNWQIKIQQKNGGFLHIQHTGLIVKNSEIH